MNFWNQYLTTKVASSFLSWVTAIRSRRTMRCQELSRCYLLIALTLSLIVVACTNTNTFKSFTPSVAESSLDTALTLWWDKGYSLEEDEALQRLVSNWEQYSGNKIKLSFYTDDELPQKTQRALRAGHPPDIMFSYQAGRSLNPSLAQEGKLADVSDVIEPVKSLYPDSILQNVNFYNRIAKKRSYYAVPIHQATIHIFYWRDLLKQVGLSESDIPKEWDAFWEFWKQVQHNLRLQQKQNIYGLGFPLSIASGDTYFLFEQILEAYDVEILDSQGQLRLNDPQVRQGLIEVLDWYTNFYQQGYVPQSAVNWLNPDNNRNLLNRVVVMTPNPTLSIPSTVRQDSDTYYRKLGTLGFPNKPNGKPMRYVVTVNQVVVFAESKNQKQAKDFLLYLNQPQVLGDYLKAVAGRSLPVLKPNWKDPFWTNPADPHLATAAKTLIKSQTRPFHYVQNSAYSLVLEENVWGKALNRIVVNGISPEQAADEAIERIEQIFHQWL